MSHASHKTHNISTPADGDNGIFDDALKVVTQLTAERSQRVAIIDSDSDSAEVLGMALEYLGYDVNIFKTEQDGLGGMQLTPPDLVLVEILLPNEYGSNFVHKIKDYSWGSRVKLVAVTGWGTTNDLQPFIENGFHRHFLKPIEFAKLEAAMRSLCAFKSS